MASKTLTPRPSHTLWTDQGPEKDVTRIAARVAADLTSAADFCLWLDGPMGAGKTTMTRAILYALGLPAKVPVLSPTYTYMTEYQLPNAQWFAHLDLYRMPDLAGIEEAGIDDRKKYHGVFVEWPPHSADIQSNMLRPTHVLSIQPATDTSERHYTLLRR